MGHASTSHDSLIGHVIGGRYEIVRLIGKGGMGAIYEVRNTRLGRSFALKTLIGDAATNREVLARFRREADAIARIKHPNIVEVIDWESLEDGSPCMVLEYLQGEDLAKRIEEAAPLPWPTIARFGDQILSALAVAHAAGIVHRDLKPQNIFLANDDSGEERVKLLDFGVSKIRDQQSLVTTDARLIGTPSYMAPEQAEGRMDDIGPATDLWALGAILHELATGKIAFDAPTLPSVLYKICHASPEPIRNRRPDASDAFVALVDEALSRDPSNRLADADVMRVRLREAFRDMPDVRFSDVRPVARPLPTPLPTRAKRYTGANDATISNERLPIPRSSSSSESSSIDATANTIATGDTPLPSTQMRESRRRRSVALLATFTAITAAMIVAVIVISTSKTSSKPIGTPATAAPAPSTTPPPTAPAQPTTATEPAIVPVDAAVVEQPPTPAAKLDVAKTPKRPAKTSVKPEPKSEPKVEPTPKPEPPKVEPKPDPKKCAKDDPTCIYGDGT